MDQQPRGNSRGRNTGKVPLKVEKAGAIEAGVIANNHFDIDQTFLVTFPKINDMHRRRRPPCCQYTSPIILRSGPSFILARASPMDRFKRIIGNYKR